MVRGEEDVPPSILGAAIAEPRSSAGETEARSTMGVKRHLEAFRDA